MYMSIYKHVCGEIVFRNVLMFFFVCVSVQINHRLCSGNHMLV